MVLFPGIDIAKIPPAILCAEPNLPFIPSEYIIIAPWSLPSIKALVI